MSSSDRLLALSAPAIGRPVCDGLAHHETWHIIARHLFSGGRDEILAKTLVVIVTFIPFFGFWEIDRVLGHGKLFELFFHKRTA